ncbi:MAG: hypothetical protein GXP31_03135 [Kiritimatiellaeota bacterium]|nr:hypothetical protein [Kiritimatiellota bacterium]
MKLVRKRSWFAVGFGMLVASLSIFGRVEELRGGPYKAVVGKQGRMTVWRGTVPVVTRSYSGMFGRLPTGSILYYASTGYELSVKKVVEGNGVPSPRLVLENGGRKGVRMHREIIPGPAGVEVIHRFRIPLSLGGWIDTGFTLNPDLSVSGTVRYWPKSGGEVCTGRVGAGADCLPYSTAFRKVEFISEWGTLRIEFKAGEDLQPYGALLNLAKSSRRPGPEVQVLPLSQAVHKGKGPACHASDCIISFDPVPGKQYLPKARNVILNGSFEAWSNPDLPDGWRRTPYATQDTAARLAPDPGVHFHGRRGLKWTAPQGALTQVLARSDYRTSAPLTPPVAFSLYLKSDPPGVQIALVCGGVRKTVTASGDWQRAMVVAASGKRFPVAIEKKSPGTLWLDAVQLERGESPTPYVDRSFSSLVGKPRFPADLLRDALRKAETNRPALTGCGPERSCYTTEKRGRLFYRVDLPPEERIEAVVRIRIVGPDGRLIREFEKRPDVEGRIVAEFAVSDVPVGTSKARAELVVRGKPHRELQHNLVRLPPLSAGTEVKIDRRVRVLLRNGSAFIPVGSDAASSVARALQAIRDQKANGFNVIHVWSGFAERGYSVPAKLPAFHPDELKTVLDAAQSAGLAVIVHLGHWLTINHSERDYYRNSNITDAQTLAGALEVVRFARRHPALLMWYLYDEPSPRLCSPEYLEQVYRAVKEADPYHPAMVNFCASAERMLSYRDATDLMAIDIYPVPQSHIGIIAPHARLMWVTGGWRPVLWWIQSWASLREPTAAEETCMAYQALVEGTRAILFYNYRPTSYAAWAGLGRIAAEINALRPALVSPDRHPVEVRGGSGRVSAVAYRVAGGLVVVAVNRDRIPVDAEIVLPTQPAAKSAADKALVLFENRRVDVETRVLRDRFPPLGRHVYRLRTK